MSPLADFMESLNQEKYELVQMGTIKYSENHALSLGFLNPFKGKKKYKYSKQQEKKKQDKPRSLDGGSNPSKEKDKKNKEKTKFTYCHKGWHLETD